MKPAYAALISVGLIAGLYGAYLYQGSSSPGPVASQGVSDSLGVTAPPGAGQEPALIGSLRSRTHTIHLFTGKFTVEDADGKVLAKLVDEKQFALMLPDLFDEFKQTYADGRGFADNRTHGKLSNEWVYTPRSRR